MKRNTQERRRENGLRQGARTTDISSSKSSMVRGNSGLTTESKKRNEHSIAPTPLIATAALQAYLSSDIDAKSRIPRPRPAPESRDNKMPRCVIPSDEKSLSSLNTIQRSEIKRSENAKPTQLRVPVRGNDPPPAKSPLSRFQKHMKQIRSADCLQTPTIVSQRENARSLHNFRRGDTISATRTPDTQSLTRSLLDKIKEAKGLRQVEQPSDLVTKHHRGPEIHTFLEGSLTNSAYPDSLQPNVKSMLTVLSLPGPERPDNAKLAATTMVDSKSSPPLPHAKPVMPMIPQLPPLPSPEKSTLEKQNREESTEKPARKQAPKETKSSVNDVIMATKAVWLIQRMWRRKRRLVRSLRRNCENGIESDRHKGTQVTLIIDKSCEEVTPLSSVAKSTKQQEQQHQQQHLKQEDEADLVDDRGYTTEFHPSYYPWTDHELVFLEEGRCIGELHESVRKGVFMDQDELVWKRPQQVIQQLETQRVSMTQKTRKKRASSRQIQDQCGLSAPCSNVNDSSSTMSPIHESAISILSGSQVVSVPTSSKAHTREKMTRRKRKLPRVHLVKHRRIKRKPDFRARRGVTSSKTRRTFVRVLQVKRSSQKNNKAGPKNQTSEVETRCEQPHEQQIDEVLHCQGGVEQCCSSSSDVGEIEKQSAERLDRQGSSEVGTNLNMFDRFVVFSDREQALIEVDTNLPRNDLISVGDLALARSLLYDERHQHVPSDVLEQDNGFIPLTFPIPSSPRTQPTTHSELLSDESAMDPLLVTSASSREWKNDENGGDDHAGRYVGNDVGDVENVALEADELQRVSHMDGGPEDMAQHEHSWDWEDIEGDNNAVHGSFTSSGSCVVDEMTSTDPMHALNVIKGAVTDTMARIHTEYRDEPQDDEHPNSNQQIIPVAEASRLRLDEEKRIEFLRVLDDFKCCLRPSSCASSTRSSLLS